MSAQKHVVVIGAGVVGASTALYLVRDGHRVTMIDRGPPGEATSFGNAAVIEPHGVIPVPSPGVLWRVPRYLLNPRGPLAIRWGYLPRLTPWLARFVWNSRPAKVRSSTEALDKLLRPTIEVWRELLRSLGVEDMMSERGWLAVAETEATWRAYQPQIEVHRRYGAPPIVLKPEEIRQHEPSLAPLNFAGAAFYPKVAHVVSPLRIVQTVAGAAQREGATLVRDEVVGFEQRDGKVVAVKGRERSHPCDGVVVTGGAWSRGLAAALGARVPLDTERGYHVMLPNAGVAPRQPVLSLEGGYVATPLEHGLRVAGTDELGGLKLPPNWQRAEVLLDAAKRWFPKVNTEGVTRWMGYRPSLPDSVPVISQAPGASNAWMGFGHGHLGLTMGARTGQLIAALVSGRDPGIDMKPYRADRF